jgi:hypothetical protein
VSASAWKAEPEACNCSWRTIASQRLWRCSATRKMRESHAENQAALTFRAASRADVADAVPLIYSSGPAAFDYVFNVGGTRDAQAFLRFAYLHGGGEFGWRVHRIAEMGRQVVAVGAAFDGRTVMRFTIAGALQICGFYGPIHAWGVMARGLRVEAIICSRGSTPSAIAAQPSMSPSRIRARSCFTRDWVSKLRHCARLNYRTGAGASRTTTG